MGQIFQDEWQEKHPSGCSLWFIMEKEKEKALERHEALIDILFMKIMENRRK